MSDATKHALENKLVRLRWEDKDSIYRTKRFIQDAKDILAPYIANDDGLQQILFGLVQEDNNIEGNIRSGNASSLTLPIDAIVLENLPVDPYVPPTPTNELVRTLHKPTYLEVQQCSS